MLSSFGPTEIVVGVSDLKRAHEVLDSGNEGCG
jgi:hypothetical protein